MKKNGATGLELLERAYAWERTDEEWIESLVDETCRLWDRALWGYGYFYDASNIHQVRVWNFCERGTPRELRPLVEEVVKGYSPATVATTYRATAVGTFSQVRSEDPTSAEILAGSRAADVLILNGLDPSGRGCLVGVATPTDVDARSPFLRRVATHLSSAYRCRRRLQEGSQNALTDAEAVLDPAGKLLDAQGPAATKWARRGICDAFRAIRDLREKRRGEPATERWWPRVQGRWTLVDVFTHRDERYIVARENQTAAPSLAVLTDRERQVVASAAGGRSTKEIAYDLGISYSTARVLLSRAYARLGVSSREELLALPGVVALRGAPPGE